MRILHFADLHLGVETYGRIDPETGLSTRLGDFLAVFDEVVNYAINEEVDLFLFCGDAYRSREPSQTHQREFARRIARLASQKIPTFLLVGNHDLPNAVGRATSVEIFDTLSVQDIYVAPRPGTYMIQTKKGVVQVVALPWMRRNALLSREEYSGATVERLNQIMEQKLLGYLQTEVQSLDSSLPAILAGHLFLSGARVGSERTMMVGADPVMLKSNLANPTLDYVALGHVHRHQEIEAIVPMAYAGSLQRVDFGEEEEKEKGFYMLELDENKGRGERFVSLNFRSVKARRFLTLRIDANSDNPTATVLQGIARKEREIKDAIVRLYIKINSGRESLLEEGEIRRALKEASYIAAVVRETDREVRTRLGSHVIDGLTPLDALRLYLESKKTSTDRIELLLKCGRSLIEVE